MGRTNIVLNDRLIAKARKMTGLKKKTEIVDFALKALVDHEAVLRIRKFQGSGIWVGDLDAMRRSRF